MNLQFDETTHTYFWDGKKIPSVTQIINELLPIQYKPDDWYLQRGQAVHRAAVFIAREIDFEYDERIAGQVAAIRKFFKEVRPEILEIEKTVYSKIYRYAGRLDLYVKIGTKFCLVDYKSSISIERIGLQLAGYSLAMLPVVINGVGIAIKEDGTYSMTKPINLKKYQREFLALRATYGVRERLGLNKKEEAL